MIINLKNRNYNISKNKNKEIDEHLQQFKQFIQHFNMKMHPKINGIEEEIKQLKQYNLKLNNILEELNNNINKK